MKNTIFKKIRPLHSKNNSKYYKNNDNYNKNKKRLNDSDNNYNTHIKNIIYDSNINENDSINVNKFMSIEKASHSSNIYIFDKRKTFKNNLNYSNESNKNKKEYIYIKKEKQLFEKISSISPKKNINKELEMNKNESNSHFICTTKKKINKKTNKENLISIKKYTNDLKKNILSSVTKEKEEKNKIIVNSNRNLKNLNRSNENNDESLSLNEVKTIKDESLDLESSFSTEKIDIFDKNKCKNKKKENEMEEIFIKEPNTENNIKNKYKQKNLKIENNKRKVINGRKKKNNNLGSNTNNKDKKNDEEEEKTIIYKNDNINNLSGIKIMNYFKELIKKNNENNDNNENKENSENNNIKKKKRIEKNNKLYNNLSDNILSSEKKNDHIDFFKRSNELIKEDGNDKLLDNSKKCIVEKNEIIKKKKKNNLMLNNISNDKLKFIREELLIKRKKENNRYDNIDENENVSNNSINKKILIKNEENNDNSKMKRKKTKNSLDFTVKKKSELKNINPNTFSSSSKNNDILFMSCGTNISEDKKINNRNSLNENRKKINRLMSKEIINKNETNEKNLTNKINSYNNYIDFKYTTKKNKTYFLSNDSNKIFNNSSNDIHINNSNDGKIKDNNNNMKKYKKNKNIKIINNNNNNSSNINNGGVYECIKKESSSVRNNRSNNYLKRSISPHLSNVPFYSKISNKLVLINKKSKKNNNNNNNRKKREFNLNLKLDNIDPHKKFFRIEDRKNNINNNSNSNSKSYNNSIINSLNNMNCRYSNNINNNTTVINFYLDEIIIDLSKSTKDKSNYLFNKINNNCYTFTKGDKHISPSNNYFKRKKMFSSFCSKGNKNPNPNPIFSDNKISTVVLNGKNKNKNAYKKSKIKINVENIINSEFNSSIYINKYKTNKNMNKNKKINNINANKKKENESFVDIQIPLVPEENIQVISLKTMKYNQCIKNSQFFFCKLEKIFQNEKLVGMILIYLTNKDLFNLSLVNNSCFKMTSKSVLKKIMNKIIYNINKKKLIEKIWNNELLKYSNFNHMNNFDNVYLSYLNNSKKYDCDINKDLLRTFPKDDSFHKGSESYNKLFNVLRAYSNYNNEIGYAQGMNFIVAKLIVFFKKEKESFIYLDSLFNKLDMVNVIGVYNNLEKKMKIFQFLLKKFCPDVIAFMEKEKINHEIFTASWFITLFSKNFKYDNILLILWNFSIIFGWKFIYLFSISVIAIFKEKYIKLDLYDFTQYMKNIFVFENFKNKFKDIMNLTFYYLSKWKNIQKDIEKEFFNEIKIKKIKKIKNNNEFANKSFYRNSEVEDDETNYIFP